MNFNNKRELQNIAFKPSEDIDYKDFLKTYGEYTKELYYFMMIDTTLPASDLLRSRKDLLPIYKNDSN